MKIIPLAHQVIGKLALIGLLFSPFALTPSYAAELVGKPVAVGAQVSAQVSSADAAQVSSQANIVSATSTSAQAAPIPPNEPIPAEPPVAPDVHERHHAMESADEMREAMEEMRANIDHDMPSNFGSIALNPETIIPIVAMLLLFGGPVLLLLILAILHYRAKARRQQNINMNIDKLLAAGRDIPVEMLLGEEVALKAPVRTGMVAAYSSDNSTMQKGVRNIGLGTGWLVFLTIMFGIKIGSFGFIFIGLGISQLVIWKLSSTGAGASPKTEAPETLRAQD